MNRTRKFLAVAALAIAAITGTSMFGMAHAAKVGALSNVHANKAHTVGCTYTGVGCK
jgi:hypothetical protein